MRNSQLSSVMAESDTAFGQPTWDRLIAIARRKLIERSYSGTELEAKLAEIIAKLPERRQSDPMIAEIRDARVNLMGALIDIERAHGHADVVCIDTIKRVIEQLRALERSGAAG